MVDTERVTPDGKAPPAALPTPTASPADADLYAASALDVISRTKDPAQSARPLASGGEELHETLAGVRLAILATDSTSGRPDHGHPAAAPVGPAESRFQERPGLWAPQMCLAAPPLPKDSC